MANANQPPPLAVVRGEGAWLIDAQGKRYFDAISSWWVNLFGHSDAGLRAAIGEQLQRLPHVMLAGCTHEPAVRLAERLSARTGGALGHCFFASDGASAVEIALKQSFHSWRNRGFPNKKQFVCLKNGYHGETLGALSVTDVQIFKDAYGPLLMQSHQVESPDTRLSNEAASLQAMASLLAEHHAQIAAVIVEPLIQCAAGMRMHSPLYLRQLRALCRQHQVHLIADEIAVGCGRSGRFFAWEHVLGAGAGAPRTGTQAADWPDFLLLSKGITGGTLPLSLVLTTDAVFEAFWSPSVARGFLHSHSYTGNALACAAANAVLDRFDAGLCDELAQQADWLAQGFAPLAAHPAVAHLRQRGTVLAFDVPSAGPDFSARFHQRARAHQLLVRPIGQTVYLMPPYLLDPDAVDFLARAITRTLDEVLHAA